MSDNLTTGIVTVVMGIIGIATIAVIVGNKAQTAGVIGAAGGALAQNITAAVSPVTGTAATYTQGTSSSQSL